MTDLRVTEVRLDRGEQDHEPVLQQVRGDLHQLQQLTIDCAHPLESEVFPQILDLVREAPRPPALVLHLTELPGAAPLRKLLGETLVLAGIRVDFGPHFARALTAARDLLPPERDLTGRILVAPDNWHDLEFAAALCETHEARLLLSATDERGHVPIAGLPLADQRFLCAQMGTLWPLLSGQERPASLAGDSFALLHREILTLVLRAAESAVYDQPGRALRGQGAHFTLPPLEHVLLADPERGSVLWNNLTGLKQSASVLRWAERLLGDPKLVDSCRERPWLRLILQKVATEETNDPLFAFLRGLYGRAPDRKRFLREELELAQRVHNPSTVEFYHQWLGLDRIGGRRRPFRLPPHAAPEKAPRADTTILIPSYRHERYIEDCIHSALAQSHAQVHVLVVDDRSPDATVERARSIDDPRLEVRVNEENLGLGNSVLRALETIDTPYVALLNSDDVFHPERIQASLDALQANPEAQLVTTNLYVVDSEGAQINPRTANRLTDGGKAYDWVHWYEGVQPKGRAGKDLFHRLLRSNFLATSTNLVCRTDYLRGQAESLQKLKYCLDWQLFLNAAIDGVLVYLERKLASYRLHADNTVWFERSDRWRYSLEVARVIARTMNRFLEHEGRDPDSERRALEAVVEHLSTNSEVNPYGIYLNDLIGGLELEARSEADPEVAETLQTMTRRATEQMRIAQRAQEYRDEGIDALPDPWRAASLEVARLLGEMHAEQARSVSGTADWLRTRNEEIERELQTQRARHRELQQDRQRLQNETDHQRTTLDRLRSVSEAIARQWGVAAVGIAGTDAAAEVVQPLGGTTPAEVLERLERRMDAVAELMGHGAKRLQELAGERDQLTGRLEQVTSERGKLRSELDERLTENGRLETELTRVRGVRDDLQQRLSSTEEERQRLERERQRLEGEREVARSSQRRLKQELTSLWNNLAATRSAWVQEISTLRRSREYRTGNLFWNKIPLTSKSARYGKYWYRRGANAADSMKMMLKRLFGRKRSKLRVAAASTADFPVPSHTFVYQELMSYHQMLDAEVKLFHWLDGDRDALPRDFEYLRSNKSKLQSLWDIHQEDYQHYQRTRPDKVESLKKVLLQHVEMSAEELEQDYQFRQSFTFARKIELYQPDFLHTYFFYEESLFGFVAQWLLGIPRAVSCYADHMMKDYPYKLVDLHMQTADVVVATSRRIKEELIGLSSPEHADKIIVKPNGVDGRRFPFIERQPHQGPLELLSVSRLEPKKGLIELVDAVKKLTERGVQLRIHVVGSADPGAVGSESYAERFRLHIAEQGVEEAFILHGLKRQDELQPLMQSCNGFVAPYVETESGDKDGIPTAILEGMSSGLPILATDAGSITEIVDDGKQGWVVPQRDVGALAAMLEKAYKQGERLPEMGRAARARFDTEFDARVVDARLHERVQQILAASRVRTA